MNRGLFYYAISLSTLILIYFNFLISDLELGASMMSQVTVTQSHII